MIVVDTNVVASLYLETPASADAERALERDPAWAAPLLWRSELRNVLATLSHSHRLEWRDAIEITRAAEILLGGREFAVPSPDALGAAARSGCTANDCEFVALAGGLGVPLVSLDRALVRAFPKVAINLAGFTS